MFQQILMPVRAPHFEIIGARPLGFAFDLVPTVEDFLHLDGLFFPDEATRRLVGLGPGVTFDLDWDELHLRVFRQRFAPGIRLRGTLKVQCSMFSVQCSMFDVSNRVRRSPRGVVALAQLCAALRPFTLAYRVRRRLLRGQPPAVLPLQIALSVLRCGGNQHGYGKQS